MSNVTPIGKLILSALEEKEWSQRDLQRYSGVSNTEIGKIIKGDRKQPSIENIKKIAKALGKPIEPFLKSMGVTLLNIAQGSSMRVPLPIVGTVKAGFNGLAFEDHLGTEWVDVDDISHGADYIWLKIKGDSMITEGIFDGDLALIRIQPDIENGSLGVVIVNGDEGTIKRIFKTDQGLILQSGNPSYPPQVVSNDFRIVGQVKEIKRKF